MDWLKWLELAADKGVYRPQLSWAYQIKLLDEPITIASNGYAAHWVHAQQWDDIVAFKKSKGRDSAEKWLDNCPSQFEKIIDMQVCLRVVVSALSLAQAFKVTKASYTQRYLDPGFVKMWYEPGGKLHIFQVGDAGDVTTTIDAHPMGEDRPRPLRMCFQRRLILDALKMFHKGKTGQMIELNFGCYGEYAMHAVLLGQPKQAEAIVMAVNAGKVAGLDWWNNLPTR